MANAPSDFTKLGEPPWLTTAGAIATITLRRPAQANRLSLEDVALLRELLKQVQSDDSIRVLHWRGEGEHFCSGFDLDAVASAGAAAARAFEALADEIEALRAVTIVWLQGGAFGGAVDLALAADFRVGCQATRWMIPAARIGLHFYRGGMERLVAVGGLAAARRLLLATDTLKAQELERFGMLDRCMASPEEVPTAAQTLGEHLSTLAPLALLGMKRHVRDIGRGRLDAAALEADLLRANHSEDLREGAQALRANRPAVFKGL